MSLSDIPAFLGSLDGKDLVAMFWYLIFLEAPRFIIANLVAGLLSLSGARKPGPGAKFASVSIVIPCHNGAAGIAKTVTSLREQTVDIPQIIVVDDGSTDDTPLLAERLRQQGSVDLILSTGLRGGKSAALNLGLQYCTGEIVVSADADTTFDRDGIERIVAAFREPGIGATGGNIAVRNSYRSWLAAMQAVEYTITISLGRKVSAMLGIVPVLSGAFAAFRREALLSVGGWDAGSGEDADLVMKLRCAGWEIDFASDALALTDAPATVPALIQQRLRWEADLVKLHLRKFSKLFSPTASRFSLRDTLSTIDALLLSIGMSIAFVAYVLLVFATYGRMAVPILTVTAFVYTLIGTANFLIAVAVGGNPSAMRLLPYAFGHGIYCISILHPVRIWACIDELAFDRSYRSSFVPKKVLNRVWRY